ncbi:MAG: chromate resistance protein ChrB [Deltaproteobacteria bacterium]|nr:chromate resistance protein ChrB [Deltaproteobacteria bacterium]
MLTYRVPPEPTRFRTYIWRQVKAFGCLHLQQAVWLLPDTPGLNSEFRKLVSKIEEFGGEASLLTTVSPDSEWETKVIAGFNAIRDEEYAEIEENGERFEDEVNRETRKEKFTFAELEDLEADWEKLKRWKAKVQERDFFDAPGRQEAEARVAEGAKLLEGFTRKVYEREGMEGPVVRKDDPGK